jgi:molybdenum transport protein
VFNLTTQELEAYIADDIPYFDLTTYLQDVQDQQVKLTLFTRDDIVIASIEEAYKIAQLFNCQVLEGWLMSGDRIKSGESILSLIGDYNDIHKAWRSIQILLEYSCQMATYTFEMKKSITKVNPNCELLATRKSFPFAKRFCIKSIMVGGAMPHRLGLSETIVLFAHHRSVYKNTKKFYSAITKLKLKTPEKKIVVESDSLEDAIALIDAQADVIQLDKMPNKQIEKIVQYRNEKDPSIKVLVAGGINKKNAKEYAALGVDGIVTSALYNAGLANLGSRLELL